MNTLPTELAAALDQHTAAKILFDQLPPSHQQEYIRWIMEAKQETTRQRRAEKTITMLMERNTSED